MFKSFLAAVTVAFGTSAFAAAPIDVSANIFNGSQLWGTASFVGTDTNADGHLSLGELSSFDMSIAGYTPTLADVNAFGTYTIASNTWNDDAEAWGQYATGSFVTWANDGLAVTSINGFSVQTTAVSAVPEPSALVLMSLAGLGALVARRRKSA